MFQVIFLKRFKFEVWLREWEPIGLVKGNGWWFLYLGYSTLKYKQGRWRYL